MRIGQLPAARSVALFFFSKMETGTRSSYVDRLCASAEDTDGRWHRPIFHNLPRLDLLLKMAFLPALRVD